MNQEANTYNIIGFILWSLVGLLGGLIVGNLVGFVGRELVFPAVLGFIVVSLFAYRQVFESTETNEGEVTVQAAMTKEPIAEEVATNDLSISAPVSQKKMGQIDGVVVTDLKTFPDDRGYFREMFRLVDTPLIEVAQVSATTSYPGVVKAFHYHNKQDDLWYCAKGMIHAVMYDRRPNSRTYGTTQVVPMGDLSPRTLYIPKGVVHGYEVLGPESALVIYATTQTYDPNDELRIPHDDAEIGYNWGIKPR